ncbi:hypothetical protein ACFL54_04255 [Planctomycetota bacterium]
MPTIKIINFTSWKAKLRISLLLMLLLSAFYYSFIYAPNIYNDFRSRYEKHFVDICGTNFYRYKVECAEGVIYAHVQPYTKLIPKETCWQWPWFCKNKSNDYIKISLSRIRHRRGLVGYGIEYFAKYPCKLAVKEKNIPDLFNNSQLIHAHPKPDIIRDDLMSEMILSIYYKSDMVDIKDVRSGAFISGFILLQGYHIEDFSIIGWDSGYEHPFPRN